MEICYQIKKVHLKTGREMVFVEAKTGGFVFSFIKPEGEDIKPNQFYVIEHEDFMKEGSVYYGISWTHVRDEPSDVLHRTRNHHRLSTKQREQEKRKILNLLKQILETPIIYSDNIVYTVNT